MKGAVTLNDDKLQITLAAARVNAGMTQEDVAERMHVRIFAFLWGVINWEKGKVSPAFATLQALSALYRIPIDNIFLPVKST